VKLARIVEKLSLAVRTGSENLDTEVTAGYSSDLMSDVIAHARAGSLWITLQIHQNIVAVASMNELAGIVGNRRKKRSRKRRPKVCRSW
jgi:hypothetical protein